MPRTVRSIGDRIQSRVRRLAGGLLRGAGTPALPMAARALAWVRANQLRTGGVRVQSRHPHAYAEVTGYLIPTLLAYGDRDLAVDLIDWLLCSQRADGSFTDPDENRSYAFDTAQVLRGLLAGIDLVPGAAESARRAADHLVSSLLPDGRFPPTYSRTDCPEAVHLYALPPLRAAADALGVARYRAAAERSLEAYIGSDDCCRIGDLTHFLAYQLDALVSLGRADLARPVLQELATMQRRDGSIRGRGGVEWVCTPGVAQLAICWYLVGFDDAGDAALRWLETVQEPSGGFRGSYGPGAAYKPDVEISWAVKFALDAHRRRLSRFFARHVTMFPADVAPSDGRLQAVLAHIADGDRVLEVGCGKGRFLKAVANTKRVTSFGVDPSPELLQAAAPFASIREGALERIPHADATFDVVFAVEALEHSTEWARAVDELVRVAKPGGWIVIIDKHAGAWGRMPCPSWERWPAISHLTRLLRARCDEVTATSVGYDGHPASDGLMMAWCGRRRTRLTGDQWNVVLGVADLTSSIVDEVRSNQFSDWGRTVIRHTAPGERVLEIGSGTGKISLQLAMAGRRVTCLDASAANLAFVAECARRLGTAVGTSCADATRHLPFADRVFDCVWSSGLLEHFDRGERRTLLREWARVCRRRMIHLVPNAAAVAYRYGKAAQERDGLWPYGLEMPLATMRDDYEAAGITVLDEFTVAPAHGLNFVRHAPTRRALERVMSSVTSSDLQDWRQGYLLVTVGEVGRTC